MRKRFSIIIVFFTLLAFAPKAHAVPDGLGNEIFTGNVGIGTTTPQGALVVNNGNVGIGTWAPQAALDMGPSGSIRLGGVTETSWSAVGSNYWLNNGGSNVGINTTQAVGIGTSFVGGSGEATLSVMNGNVGIGTWVPGGSLIVQSGNVGIGLAKPLDVLQVNGGIRFGSASFTSGVGKLYTDSSLGTVLSANTGSTNDFSFVNASGVGLIVNPTGTDNLILSNFGKIGIGTTSPGSLLDILGGNVGIGTFIGINGALIVDGGNVGIGSNAPNGSLDVGPTGTICIGGTCESSWSSIGSNYWLNNGGSNVGINTTQAVGIGTSFVGGSGEATLSVMNGNVGIGTWVPVTPFQVKGSSQNVYIASSGNVGVGTNVPAGLLAVGSTSQFWIDSTGDITGETIGLNGVGNTYTYSGYTGTANSIVAESITSGIMLSFHHQGSAFTGDGIVEDFADPNGTFTGDYLYFENDAVAKFVVDSNGNVGIGTWTTNSALQVVGNVGIGTTAPGGNLDVGAGTICLGHSCQSSWPSGGSNYWLNNGGSNVGINTTQAVGIGTSFVGGSGEATLSIMNGNVGIGTWVPASLLGINVAPTATANYGTLSIGNGSFSGSGAGHYAGSTYGTDIAVNNASAYTGDMLNLQVNGISILEDNVANGNPSSVLYVGSANVDTSSLVIQSNNSYAEELSFDASATEEWQFYVGASPYVLNLYNNGGSSSTPEMTFMQNGNVGIGTAAPTGILEVEGGNVGIGTWTAPSGGTKNLVVWGNVGVGTTFIGGTGEGALTVMNGNVGIGTWVPADALQVNGGMSFNYRVGSTASSTTPSIAVGPTGYDIYKITALAGAITTVTFTGTPSDGYILELIITDNGTARALTFGAGSTIVATTVAAPTTTVASTPIRIFFQYEAGNGDWYVIGVA